MYEAEPMINLATNYLEVVFPENPLSLSNNPSVYVAVQGVLLARMHERFEYILPTALYDLARTLILSVREFMGSSSNQPASGPLAQTNILQANEADLLPVMSKADKCPTFQDLGDDDFVRLNVLQKHLSNAWDNTLDDILSVKFSHGCGAHCGLTPQHVHLVVKRFMAMKSRTPLDPIIGIKAIIDENLLKPHCRPVVISN
ncbi:hypothetical protein D9619_013257 [Psilocybe cf. subviscida]|uniref:Uncharacterized protein n=1 Tax=Psilocybe cf. subviscida TaxID=2480587 RepID=A0A8H5F977_9AGAR|nr:hypothetical protein D9619_013257 [Psilocybe cf. subviscida]